MHSRNKKLQLQEKRTWWRHVRRR